MLAGLQAGEIVQGRRCPRLYSLQRHGLHRRPEIPGGAIEAHQGSLGQAPALLPGREEERLLAVDAKTPSTMLAHKAGYIDRDNEVIVGLQTDEPFKRAIFPYGGLRMVEAGPEGGWVLGGPPKPERFSK